MVVTLLLPSLFPLIDINREHLYPGCRNSEEYGYVVIIVTHLETDIMNMNTHPKIQNILDTLPTFISEMDIHRLGNGD